MDYDTIDLHVMFDTQAKNFTGTTAQDAIEAGYIYFLQNCNATTVMFDSNGGSHADAAKNSPSPSWPVWPSSIFAPIISSSS